MYQSFLSRQTFCCDKHVFVATKHVFCPDKSILYVFVATNIILSRQKFCHGKHTNKNMLAATNTCLCLPGLSARSFYFVHKPLCV